MARGAQSEWINPSMRLSIVFCNAWNLVKPEARIFVDPPEDAPNSRIWKPIRAILQTFRYRYLPSYLLPSTLASSFRVREKFAEIEWSNRHGNIAKCSSRCVTLITCRAEIRAYLISIFRIWRFARINQQEATCTVLVQFHDL